MRNTLRFRSALSLASVSTALGLTGITYSIFYRGLRLGDDFSDVAAVATSILIATVANSLIWSRWRVNLPRSCFWLGTGGRVGLALGSFLLCVVLYRQFWTTARPLLRGGDLTGEYVLVCGGLVLTGGLLASLAFFGVVPAWRQEPKLVVWCPSCGYNMTGLHEARCPECGTKYTLDELFSATGGPIPREDQHDIAHPSNDSEMG